MLHFLGLIRYIDPIALQDDKSFTMLKAEELFLSSSMIVSYPVALGSNSSFYYFLPRTSVSLISCPSTLEFFSFSPHLHLILLFALFQEV